MGSLTTGTLNRRYAASSSPWSLRAAASSLIRPVSLRVSKGRTSSQIGDVRKAVHHCADDQIYPWKLQGILS
jgi:hypothetical protein